MLFIIALDLSPIISQDIFVRGAEDAIIEHAAQKEEGPLFLYLAFQSVHAPLQVPQVYEDMYPDEPNPARKTYSGGFHAFLEIFGALDNVHQPLICLCSRNGDCNG